MNEEREQVILTANEDCRLPSAAAARRRGPSGLAFQMNHFAADLVLVKQTAKTRLTLTIGQTI